MYFYQVNNVFWKAVICHSGLPRIFLKIQNNSERFPTRGNYKKTKINFIETLNL